MKYIIPAVILLVAFAATIKRLPVYSLFTSGAKSAIDLSLSLFPYIFAISTLIELLRSSGGIDVLTDLLSPILGFFGIPEGLFPLVVFRPFSGGGSIAILSDIYKTYGADAYESRVASVIAASSDAVLYIGAVYFSSAKAKGSGKAIAIALFSSFFGVVLSALLCRFM